MLTVEIIFLMLVSLTTDEIGTLTRFFLIRKCKTSNGFARSCVYNIGLKVTVTLFVC